MTVTVDWFDHHQHILHIRIIGNVTADELIHAAIEANDLSAHLPHTIHRIFDFTRAQPTLPKQLLHKLRGYIRHQPANVGKIYLVGLRTKGLMFAKIVQSMRLPQLRQLRIVNTLAQVQDDLAIPE